MTFGGFGSSQARLTSANAKKPQVPTTTEKTAFINPIVDFKPGLRIVRLLPAIPLEMVTVGTREMYKPEPEITFAEYWVEVTNSKKDSGKSKLRLFVDPFNRFDNYLWKEVISKLPKTTANGAKNRDRTLARLKFALNVFDRTPVVMNEFNQPVYAGQDGKFYDLKGKELDSSTKKARNQVVILEGSNGEEGGDHILGKITNLIKGMTVEDEAGNDIMAEPYMYDVRMTSQIPPGKEAKDVVRSPVAGPIKPMPDQEVVWNLPRYQLADFYKPYPDAALEELVEGVDVHEVQERYNILKWVQLPSQGTDNNDDEAPF